jgi:hypothetical protein
MLHPKEQGESGYTPSFRAGGFNFSIWRDTSAFQALNEEHIKSAKSVC